MCKFLNPVVNSLRWQTIHAIHRMHICMNICGQLCFHHPPPHQKNCSMIVQCCRTDANFDYSIHTSLTNVQSTCSVKPPWNVQPPTVAVSNPFGTQVLYCIHLWLNDPPSHTYNCVTVCHYQHYLTKNVLSLEATQKLCQHTCVIEPCVTNNWQITSSVNASIMLCECKHTSN